MSMAYQSLYRKYRPQKFEDIVGQDVIIRVLRNAIIKNKIAHAYLFAGPRGTGKTSTAKIFAQAVNCERFEDDVCGECSNCQAHKVGNHPDIIEMDAASNNGVDEIRKIVDRVKYTPIMGKYKVYVIDEVHMLSQGAFNALLKTLEEPPEHVIFILATTEIHKVLPTIISRCQRFDFTYIDDRSMTSRLENILVEENHRYEDEALEAVVRLSAGGLRNALTILDQAIVYSEDIISVEDIYDLTGMVSASDKIAVFKACSQQNLEQFNINVKQIVARSHDLLRLSLEIANNIKDAIVFESIGGETFKALEAFPFIEYMSQKHTESRMIQMIETIMSYIEKMKFSQNQRSYFELMFFDLYTLYEESPIENVSRETKIVSKPKGSHKEQKERSQEVVNDKATTVPKKDKAAKHKAKEIRKPSSLNVSRETFKKEKVELLSREELIRLMVSGDKAQRLEDENKFKDFDIHQDGVEWARSYRMLHDAELVISSRDFLVFSFKSEVYARESQANVTNHELREFMTFLTGIRRPIYACVDTKFKESAQEFMLLYKEGKLPAPYEKSVFMEEIIEVGEEKDESLERVLDLFGERVEIKND